MCEENVEILMPKAVYGGTTQTNKEGAKLEDAMVSFYIMHINEVRVMRIASRTSDENIMIDLAFVASLLAQMSVGSTGIPRQ